MKAMPKIQKYMTTVPHTIGKDIPIAKAQQMMKDFGIRHIPVQDGGKLVGVLTDRDVKLALSFADPTNLTTEDVMTPDPYTTAPDTSLNEVVWTMAEHKYGAAIVVSNHKVVGVFTATDAMRVLAETLQENYKPSAQ